MLLWTALHAHAHATWTFWFCSVRVGVVETEEALSLRARVLYIRPLLTDDQIKVRGHVRARNYSTSTILAGKTCQ